MNVGCDRKSWIPGIKFSFLGFFLCVRQSLAGAGWFEGKSDGVRRRGDYRGDLKKSPTFPGISSKNRMARGRKGGTSIFALFASGSISGG